ncbi:MAG: zinc-dependent metalloprotease [Actinomycetota bacterium]
MVTGEAPFSSDGDDLFAQLFRLFQSSGPVNWQLAKELTKNLAGEREPIEPGLAEEYLELAHVAELKIQAAAELPAPSPGDLNPTDRATWALENQQTFRILVEPLADKLSGSFGGIPGIESLGQMGAALQPLGPALLGMQAGTMIGFMSHRVLGQFDTGIPAVDHDKPYVVVPNVEAFAFEAEVDPRQVRLWATLHEMLFQRLMEVEWLRGHFVSVVNSFYDTVEFDLSDLMGQMGALEDPDQIRNLLGEEGANAPALLKGTSDPDRLAAIQSFTAFVEGYGDYLVRKAGADLLPDLERIETANTRRRSEPDQAEQYLQQVVGLELQRHRAGDAADFCAELESRWGTDALERIWEQAENLPTLSELTDPVGWAARVMMDQFEL